MTGRKSSRGAAVVLAGCVGLAVMAPGLALADAPSDYTTEASCEGATYTWNTTLQECQLAPGTTTSVSGGSSSSAAPTTTVPPAIVPGTPSGTVTGAVPGAQPAPPADLSSGQPSGSGAGARSANTAPVPRDLNARIVQQAEPDLQTAVNGLLPDDPTGLAVLPNLPAIPVPDTDGNFASVNAACLNAIGQLRFPAGTEGLGPLSEQLQGFCAQLDPTDLTDLVDQLLDLLNGLIPSLPTTPPATIPTTPPSNVPAYYAGYWSHRYDVNCGDVTYEEANALLAADPSDPFDLDGDNDGVACEDNARTTGAVYVGYPVGGVSTGDGSTGDADVSPAVLALAGAGVAGLALSGLTLVRRFGRES